MMKLCVKVERNRTILGGAIASSVFDLMTLNIAIRVALGSGIIFTKFDLRKFICDYIIALLISDFMAVILKNRYDVIISAPLVGLQQNVARGRKMTSR